MKRSKFSLSNNKLLSCNMGSLVPIGLTEVLPGDTIQHATSMLVRCSPLLAPVMHPVRVAIHHWYVPHRLVWEDFEDFITGGPDGNDASAFPTIAMPATPGVLVSSLADYLGVPLGGNAFPVSALPFRAYAKIWNEWYRDQDLQTELVIDETSGVDTTTNVTLQNGAWEKDYFTSARPWEQKGPSITIPLGTTAPVNGDPAHNLRVQSSTGVANVQFNTATAARLNISTIAGTINNNDIINVALQGSSNLPSGLIADLSSASAITVNALREALALQRFEEARARFGSRYSEYLRYLGVRSSDARLQRPEYLGGGRQTIQFSEVLQTAEGEDPVGELRGHGIGALRSNRYRRFIEEHGYVLSLMCVRPKTIYTQGLARTWNRRVKEDFWQRELQHVGQQEILNKEVYNLHATPNGTFGFQDRYDEYRRAESTVSGEFRTATLDHWHFARTFASDPALNATFVKSVPTEEPFAVPSQDVLYVMANHSIQARRLVASSGSSFIF